MPINRRISAALLALLVLPAFFAGCSRESEQESTKSRGAEERTLNVVASLFPLYDFARQIGRERAEVALLLPPGAEPHSFEPKPADVVRLGTADLFIYTNKAMEPWVGDLLKGVAHPGLLVVDASKGVALMSEKAEAHGHGGETTHRHGRHEEAAVDPHLWLDFGNAAAMVDNILEGFIAKDPANSEFYRRNAVAYKAQLSALDKKFSETLSRCKKRTLVSGGHFTFGYLARRYGLKYESAYGFSPDAEPTPRDIIAMSATLKEHGLTHLFYEELITPRVAETIAREAGAQLLMLHGAHNISREDLAGGATFLSLMENNLDNLSTGLQCR